MKSIWPTPEIAQAMLRRQQATAVVAARQRIAKLTERSGSTAPALHNVVQLVKGSATGG